MSHHFSLVFSNTHAIGSSQMSVSRLSVSDAEREMQRSIRADANNVVCVMMQFFIYVLIKI